MTTPATAWLAGSTMRWHIHPQLSTTMDRVDAHSGRVAILVLLFKPDASAALLKAAIIHDLGEARVGDVAYPVKRKDPAFAAQLEAKEHEAIAEMGFALPQLTNEETEILEIADKLDAYLWALHHKPNLVTTHPDWARHYERLWGLAEPLGKTGILEALVEEVSYGHF